MKNISIPRATSSLFFLQKKTFHFDCVFRGQRETTRLFKDKKANFKCPNPRAIANPLGILFLLGHAKISGFFINGLTPLMDPLSHASKKSKLGSFAFIKKLNLCRRIYPTTKRLVSQKQTIFLFCAIDTREKSSRLVASLWRALCLKILRKIFGGARS